MQEEIKLDSIKEAIDAIKNGEVIMVVDDEDRENEGDFICAAEKIKVNFVGCFIYRFYRRRNIGFVVACSNHP